MKARVTLAVFCISMSFWGCKPGDALVSRVVFTPSENLETVRLAIEFGSKIKSDFGGAYALKNYGTAFVNPYSLGKPFQVGLELNTGIVDDQDFIELAPTAVLPNGLPIGVDHPLVEVRASKPIHDKFDLSTYVDVLRTQWLGVAALFTFIDAQYFPPGLSISQVFLRDDQGQPAVIGSVFGPTLKGDGTIARAGGIALFGNIRQLIALYLRTGKPVELKPIPGTLMFFGPEAASYSGDWTSLRALERGLIFGLN
jgi:hypothetical protein